MIKDDKPYTPAKARIEPEWLRVDFEDASVLLHRTRILMMRDFCNEHIKRHGAFDIYDRAVKT